MKIIEKYNTSIINIILFHHDALDSLFISSLYSRYMSYLKHGKEISNCFYFSCCYCMPTHVATRRRHRNYAVVDVIYYFAWCR